MTYDRWLRAIRTTVPSLGVATIATFSLLQSGLAQQPSPAPAQPPASAPAQQAAPSVSVVDTEKFGPILVDRNGMTLYTWVVDHPGESTCYDSCVSLWPPALVQGPAVAPPGLPGRLGTTQRTDGTTQLTYNDWPLYLYARDAAPGEITGDGSLSSGALWPVATTGAVKAAASMGSHPRLGSVVVDANGMTLYTWDADSPDTSTCYDACATAWPPVLVDGKLIVGAGLSRVLGTTTRDDGTIQATFRNMPLYTFRRDEAPGEVNGEGSTGFGSPWQVAILQILP